MKLYSSDPRSRWAAERWAILTLRESARVRLNSKDADVASKLTQLDQSIMLLQTLLRSDGANAYVQTCICDFQNRNSQNVIPKITIISISHPLHTHLLSIRNFRFLNAFSCFLFDSLSTRHRPPTLFLQVAYGSASRMLIG